MNTEDDTFLKLKKCSFEDLRAEFVRLRETYAGTGYYSDWGKARDEIAEARGWTVKEWQKENYRRHGPLE